MEGLVFRSYIFAFVALIGGLGMYLLPKPPKDMTEPKMEALAPTNVAGFDYQKSEEPGVGNCSYRMDLRTYRLLEPFGIVARVFRRGNEQYDTVLIAGNDKENFHDPRVCFQGQGWLIDQESRVEIKTKNRGTFTASYVQIRQPDRDKNSIAIYFYKGQNGYYPTTAGLGMLMVKGLLTGKLNTDIVFYRFMPTENGVANKEFLIEFIEKYMDSAEKSSKGYF